MNMDILLTGAVVLVALIYVVWKFMKPGCGGCAKNGCGCDKGEGGCPPLADWRDGENKESSN